jgi:hypothetical protein
MTPGTKKPGRSCTGLQEDIGNGFGDGKGRCRRSKRAKGELSSPIWNGPTPNFPQRRARDAGPDQHRGIGPQLAAEITSGAVDLFLAKARG